METSEQQRRPTVRQFAQALTTAKLEFDAIDLADMLWLARFMPDSSQQPDISEETSSSASPTPPPTSTPSGQTDNQPNLPVYPQDEDASNATDQPIDSTESSSQEKSEGIPLDIPSAPAIRTRLDLARSLRPLMRKVPSRRRFDLDEAETVTQIAETEVWLPVVRPAPERWLELDLVVEAAKTTAIWEQTIAELNHLAEYQGAFRVVRTWRLSSDGNAIQLFPCWREGSVKFTERQADNISARPHTPKELIDPTGRRLIWFVTDCTSDLWRQGLVYPALQQWAAAQPMAIVQMFPPSLWKRTALRDGHQVRLSALAPGLPNSRLEVQGLTRRLEQRSRSDLVTVPIVTLDAAIVKQWARVVAGSGDSRTPGRAFDLRFIQRQVAAIQTHGDMRSPTPSTAQERVDIFRATTVSNTVKQLANLMAAAPVTLPVIDLLREVFRGDFQEEVQQSHVAEVLLSGLLYRCDTNEETVCRYKFWGDDLNDPTQRVRDILLGDASVAKTRRVLDVLSESICAKIDNSTVKTFPALLKTLNAEDVSNDLRSAAMPFARIGLDVLYRLGGEHAVIARKYDLRQKQPSDTGRSDTDWLSGFLHQKLTYQVAEYIDFPAIEPFSFNHGELIEDDPFSPPLERFDFTIATLVKKRANWFSRANWEVERQPSSAERFIEQLPNGIELEMVLIPGGQFLMGSPENEPERFDTESPQHNVSISPFCMGRYPITQAQWRAVAYLPQTKRHLDPDPAQFKGDDRPVEQVSWEDAVEFCARLSAHTERQYRLPSEAEWEYACRANTITPFHFGDTITTDVANYDGSRSYNNGSNGQNRGETTPVHQFDLANAFGLSDMHGNVWEWCEDDWHPNYEGAPNDGSAWLSGNELHKVRRGGSWNHFPRICRSAYRDNIDLVNRYDAIGFRVCCFPPRILQ